MLVYNTLHRRKEEFVPREAGKVTMYVCGVTPYDSLHLGHARTFLSYDMIRRYLEWIGYEVVHIQNVTDIDDKIIQRANQLGCDPLELSERYALEALRDCDALGMLRAHQYPRVSKHIPEIIEMIAALVEKGAAYVRGGNVYFDVSRFPRYGQLSHQDTAEMQASGRIEPEEDKDDPLDFALWKAAKPGEPKWDSPWGPGRPGWHIECSAMSLKYLGNGFDIHGGAIELQFPHHENELAQSESYTGVSPFVRYWLHGGVVFVDGKKMAKSLGNFITVQDILQRATPSTLRMMFFSTHYRSPFDYSEARLEEARAAWERLQLGITNLRRHASQASDSKASDAPPSGYLAERAIATEQRFREAMEDDFNTPVALAALFQLVSEANKYLADAPSSPSVAQEALAACSVLERALFALGFTGHEQIQRPAEDETNQLLDILVEVRARARESKQFPLADLIRSRLQEMGIILEDHPEGTTWRRKG